MFWVRSDLESRKKVRVFNFFGGGGVLGKVKLGLWEEFHFWEVCSGTKSQNTRVFWGIYSKISGSLACWCITVSLSHTTYVETNKPQHIQSSSLAIWGYLEDATSQYRKSTLLKDSADLI